MFSNKSSNIKAHFKDMGWISQLPIDNLSNSFLHAKNRDGSAFFKASYNSLLFWVEIFSLNLQLNFFSIL